MKDKKLKSVVIGSSGALGAAIVSSLKKRGDNVAMLDKVEKHEQGFFPIELTNNHSVEIAINNAIQYLDGVDVLVYAAGVMQNKPFLEVSEADLTLQLDVNLMGAFRVCQAVARHMMAKGGSIVLISSIHGQIGIAGRSVYAASKGGVEALSRVMAAELSPHNIRANVLAPGAIEGAGMAFGNANRKRWVEATPAGRVATLEEVTNAILFLSSEQSSFINAETIALDGGASTTKILA